MDKEQDPGAPGEKSIPPPPDLPKSAPPPSPPVRPDPPQGREPSDPPLNVTVSSGTSQSAPADEDAPGADASMANRIIAAVIDVVIGAGINIAGAYILAYIPGPAERLAPLLGVAYLLTRDSLPLLDGQSVGKKAMGIQAVTTAGKSLAGDWQPGLVRNVVLLIPFFAFVELFVLISRQEKRPMLRLGDEWAGTKVVNAGAKELAAAAPAAESDATKKSSGGDENH